MDRVSYRIVTSSLRKHTGIKQEQKQMQKLKVKRKHTVNRQVEKENKLSASKIKNHIYLLSLKINRKNHE